MSIPVTMTIAGSDSSGGAGIQADLKSFQELGTFGTSVVTAVTIQNTKGVSGFIAVPLETIRGQFDAVNSDLAPVAIKSGMLSDSSVVQLVAELLGGVSAQYVCDPVMVAKGGTKLVTEATADAIRKILLPRCDLITPNVPEAEVLSGQKISQTSDMLSAGRKLLSLGAKAVLMKGGHLHEKQARDFLVTTCGVWSLSTDRIDTENTHGTGCTYSAAVTAGLAHGLSLLDAVVQGKAFVHQAISNDLHLGHGHGPTNHHAFVANGSDASFVEVAKVQ